MSKQHAVFVSRVFIKEEDSESNFSISEDLDGDYSNEIIVKGCHKNLFGIHIVEQTQEEHPDYGFNKDSIIYYWKLIK